MLTWIIHKAQHLDTALVLDRTRKPFQCIALLADLGKYFQKPEFLKDSIFPIFSIFLQLYLPYLLPNTRQSMLLSGGTSTLLMKASHCFDRVKLYNFLFGRTLLTRCKLKYQNIRCKSEETSFTKIFSKKLT